MKSSTQRITFTRKAKLFWFDAFALQTYILHCRISHLADLDDWAWTFLLTWSTLIHFKSEKDLTLKKFVKLFLIIRLTHELV